MGHLSNPVGFRLSYNKKWKDLWFIKQLYYPEFVNNIINIRDYLYYYLTSKDMLENGFCISHFYLIKINKLYCVKIFLYQIDLEKSSYEYINILFKHYYEELRRFTFINYRILNKSKQEKVSNRLKSYISDLHNADFLIYYYLYYIYFSKIVDENNLVTNKYNINNNNKKLKKYTKVLYDDFMYYLMSRLKNICLINKGYKIIKQLEIEKKSRLLNIFPILLRFEQKQKLKKFEYDILDAFQKDEWEKKNDKIFKNYLYSKKKEYNKILNRLVFLKQTKIDSITFRFKKIEFLDLLFFLAKKIDFRKYKSMKKLDRKWLKLQAYIKVFQTNPYIIKHFTNLKLFYYYMAKFIFVCKQFDSKKLKTRDYLNIRDLLYFIIYSNIGHYAFFSVFNELTIFFKYFFCIFLHNMNINKVNFIYYFMSNQNVTTHLISRYIGIRLQKNFTLLKTLNPLRNELNKLYKNVIKDQKVFTIYNYKYLYLKKKKQYKKTIKQYFKVFNKFLRYFYFEYYINYKNFLIYNIIQCHKGFEFNYYFFRKIFYMNLYYRGLIDFFLIYNTKYNSEDLIIKNCIYYIFLLLKNNLYFFTKKMFKYNNKHIIISSFFYKYYINFKYLKFIWNLYKKFNYRYIKDKYIPKFKSIIMGYKMAFRGRFSRKQRASFIWFHNGKVPLNTLKCYIDYSFFIVTLKNSVVSIKVWFYLNKNCLNYKYVLKI